MEPWAVPIGDPRVFGGLRGNDFAWEALEVVFTEPPSPRLLDVYEHAEAASVPGDCD